MQFWRLGLRFLLQTPCPLCQRLTTQDFCYDCLQQLKSCQLHPTLQDWQGALPLLAWGSYEGHLKRAIAALKYQNQRQIAESLGSWLAEVWGKHKSRLMQSVSSCIVVPIPLHRDREQKRGFNQATLIAQRFCQLTQLPLNTTLLVRTRPTEAQYTLSLEGRQQNLYQAFSIQSDFIPKLKNRRILLLDDIYTTGATAYSALATLQAAQLSVVGMVAIAKAQGRPR